MHIGIDLGGTKIEAIAFDADGGQLFRQRESTPAGDYNGILSVIRDLVTRIESDLGGHGTVGIGTPGAISPRSELMRNSNSICLNGRALHKDLEAVLGRPVMMSNDANCFALSEAVDGAACDADVVFAVIIGTGTGAGVVVHGQVLTGPNAIAGEWGHNPLPWPGKSELPGADCYCGKQGCLETWLSGPGMAADHQRVTGNALQTLEIAQRAGTGDAECEATLQRYEGRLARGLASVINVLDPDVIVLGGGMSNIMRLYDNVPGLLQNYVFSDAVDTPLRQAKHGDSSGVRGAAWLGRASPHIAPVGHEP